MQLKDYILCGDKTKSTDNLYSAVMEEYEYLGHMKELKIENTKKCVLFYSLSCCV